MSFGTINDMTTVILPIVDIFRLDRILTILHLANILSL